MRHRRRTYPMLELPGAGLGLWNVPSGQWLQCGPKGLGHKSHPKGKSCVRRRERLSKGGELEYAFLFEPAQALDQRPILK